MSLRRISSNIRKLADLMKITEETRTLAVIVSVDFLKCFDMIEFQAIFGALDYFGFGPNFIQMIRTTYTDFSACVQNIGYFSEYFNVSRSVHQGGPNSSFLFLICTEILATKIRDAVDIEGLEVDDVINLFKSVC